MLMPSSNRKRPGGPRTPHLQADVMSATCNIQMRKAHQPRRRHAAAVLLEKIIYLRPCVECCLSVGSDCGALADGPNGVEVRA